MDDYRPVADWPELPEMLRKVEKIVDHFEASSRILLTLHDYLPVGTLRNDPRLHRAYEKLRVILGLEPAQEKAADTRLTGGYPVSPPSKG